MVSLFETQFRLRIFDEIVYDSTKDMSSIRWNKICIIAAIIVHNSKKINLSISGLRKLKKKQTYE